MENGTIIVLPSRFTVSIPEFWVARNRKLGNNLHFERKQLNGVAVAQGDWDAEFSSICNAILPFDRCALHAGGDGWGKEGGVFNDLQMRVYDLQNINPEQVRKDILKRGNVEIKRLTDGQAKVATEKDWQTVKLSFSRWYHDCGGIGTVDCRIKRIQMTTLVFVFMYNDSEYHADTISAVLGSISSPSKKKT